ncbi:hypothetical protein FCM35_KLT18704 [Carex littledalei]|uniref:DUF4283 domain-containing protein n=1 Tax=Carex littledalei TaxID=544730 RepID=A0A833RB32_9POAL|nr:hypothetical protein FCM35_KLT18704 [Carex littledalei]
MVMQPFPMRTNIVDKGCVYLDHYDPTHQQMAVDLDRCILVSAIGRNLDGVGTISDVRGFSLKSIWRERSDLPLRSNLRELARQSLLHAHDKLLNFYARGGYNTPPSSPNSNQPEGNTIQTVIGNPTDKHSQEHHTLSCHRGSHNQERLRVGSHTLHVSLARKRTAKANLTHGERAGFGTKVYSQAEATKVTINVGKFTILERCLHLTVNDNSEQHKHCHGKSGGDRDDDNIKVGSISVIELSWQSENKVNKKASWTLPENNLKEQASSSSQTVPIQLPQTAVSSIDWTKCALARVIADRTSVQQQLASTMLKACGAHSQTTFSTLSRNMYLVEFVSENELLRIMNQGVWSYRGDTVILQRV